MSFVNVLLSRFLRLLCGLILLLTMFGSSAMAAGVVLYEQATPDMGLAAAGRAAAAQDASIAAANPAGMTLLDRSQLVTGFLGIDVNVKFDADSATFDGGNELRYIHNA